MAGLQNLKSIFAENIINQSQIGGRHGPPHPDKHSQLDMNPKPENFESPEISRITAMDSIFSNINVVNFFNNNNSYALPFEPAPEGFTQNFNQGGYTYQNGEIGNSKLISFKSNYSPDTDDLRFTAGIGFEAGNWSLQVATEGANASLFYVNSPTGDTFGVSGAINKFGQLSSKLSNIGIDLPTIDFSAAINPFGDKFLKYSDTVFETMTGQGASEPGTIPTDINATPPAEPGGLLRYKNAYRGIAFQVLGPLNNPGGQGAVATDDKYSSFITKVETARNELGITGQALNETFLTPSPLSTGAPQLDFSYQDAVVNNTTVTYMSPIDMLDPGKLQLQIPPVLQFLGKTFTNIADELNFRNLLNFRLDNLDIKFDFLKNIEQGLENVFTNIKTGFEGSAFGTGVLNFGSNLINRFKTTMFGNQSTAALLNQFSGQTPAQQIVSVGALAGSVAITRVSAPIIIGTTILDSIFSGNDKIKEGLRNGPSAGIFQGLSGFGNSVVVPALDTVVGGAFNAIGDMLSFTGQTLGDGIQAFSPIANLELPLLQLQNPFNSLNTNYGGQGATLNSSAPVRPTGAYNMKTGTSYIRLQQTPQPSMGQRDDTLTLTEYKYPNSDTSWMERRLETMGHIESGFTGHMRQSSSRKLNEELSEENKRGEFPKYDPDIGSSKYSDGWTISNDGTEIRKGKINGTEQELNTLKSSGPQFDPDIGNENYEKISKDRAHTTNDKLVSRLGSSTGKHAHNANTGEETIPVYDTEVHHRGHQNYGEREEFNDDEKNKSILGSDPENVPTKGGSLRNTIPKKSVLSDEGGNIVPSDDQLFGQNVQSLTYTELINGNDTIVGGYNKNNKYGARAATFYPHRDSGGDTQTLAPILKGDTLDDATNHLGDTYVQEGANYVEEAESGMPFYFKDLRDNSYVIFKAYIDGITDSVSPTWNPVKYVGRSEPTYIYDSAEREISLNVHLVAETAGELDVIYGKMRRLTSMCYPEYKTDTNLNNKIRMKAPLTKFRLGELFGNTQTEMSGFLKSVSYTVPDNSTWEFRKGQRVPKLVDVTIGYQVIHGAPPDKLTMFNGYIGTTTYNDITN